MNLCEFYADVPKEADANERHRLNMIDYGSRGRRQAHELWMMCRRDLLFWVNTFCFTYDNRDPKAKYPVIPWITWNFQDDVLLTVNESLGKEDVTIVKSRDMGATWMCLAIPTHRFLFFDYESYLCASRKEDYVDKSGDPDCLFWKIDFLLQHQPKFLMPPTYIRNSLHFFNPETKTTIDGDSTTADLGRGGRRTGVFLDEYASVPDSYEVNAATSAVTNCRIFNSTPKGTGNHFYDCVQNNNNVLKLHWTLHPEKIEGLYQADGKPRSEWYDKECKRLGHPILIAQELDMSHEGAGACAFELDVIAELQRETVMPPVLIGELDYDVLTFEARGFEPRNQGRICIWRHLVNDCWPANGVYVMGVDISQGTGASESAISVVEKKTGEQVLECVSKRMAPHEWARLAVGIATWMNNAFMIWEANGPGNTFTKEVLNCGYRRIFMRQAETTLTKKRTDFPGWYSSGASKMTLIQEYANALKERKFINHSFESLNQCTKYHFAGDTVVHSAAQSNLDPSGADQNHGDRTISSALAWRGMREVKSPETPEAGPQEGSLAWHMMKEASSKGDVAYGGKFAARNR